MPAANATSPAADRDAAADQTPTPHRTVWQGLKETFGTVELENKGSVARDHLALERTFLAWLRTSLSFASIGIAISQLFRLNTSISDKTSPTSAIPFEQLKSNGQISSASRASKLHHVGKPLGATFIAIAVLVLLLGFHRYFESQHYVIMGKFPASRGSIMFITAVTGALIVAILAIVLSYNPAKISGTGLLGWPF